MPDLGTVLACVRVLITSRARLTLQQDSDAQGGCHEPKILAGMTVSIKPCASSCVLGQVRCCHDLLHRKNSRTRQYELMLQVHLKDRILLPFCAFNGGQDVFVDIGNKSLGLDALLRHLRVKPHQARERPGSCSAVCLTCTLVPPQHR